MINAVHVLDELKNLVGIADLVVVPGNDLHKGVGQSDAGLGVEDGGAGVAEEIGRNDGLVGVTQNALQLALGGFLHGVADLFVGSGLREVDSQVNDGDIQRRNTHGHAGQLAVQLGDDLADSLGSAGGRRDDVAGSSAAASPVLHGRTVNGLLGSGGGVNGGHEAVGDAELVVQDLGDRGQAVRGAGSVGDEVHVLRVLVEVDAADEHRGSVLRRSRHDDLLGTGSQMAGSLLLSQEQAGGLDNILSAELAPGQISGVALCRDGDLLAVDNDGVLGSLDGAVELAMHGIVLQHVSEVVSRAQIVDADNFDFREVQACTEDHTADTAKTIDTNFDRHNAYPPFTFVPPVLCPTVR